MLALTGLRIVAALWVVAFHFHFTPMAGVETVNGWLGPLITQGALGVDLFFVLSGFVIAWTYLDRLGPRLRLRDAGGFVWARAARMWPAYAVVFHLFGVWLVARLLFGSTTDVAYQAVQPSFGVGAWLEQLFLVQMWDEQYLDGASWVGPTWSISAEWLAYLLFPLLALGFFRLRNLPFAVLAAGSLLCTAPMAAAFLVVGSPYYPYSWLVRILGGFSAGVLAMLAVRRLRTTERVRSAASATATATVAAVPFVLLAGSVVGGGLHGLAVVAFPVLVGALALADRGPVHHLLTRGPMVHGGRISYALYLVHIPMFEIFWFLSDSGVLPRGGETGHLIALTVFVGTLPVAHLLYSLVERPARRWMRGRTRPAPEAVEAVVAPDPVPAARRVVDNDAARRDPETSVLPMITDEPVTSVLPVVSAAPVTAGPAAAAPAVPARRVAPRSVPSSQPSAPAQPFAPVQQGDVPSVTEALPVVRRRSAGPAVATTSGWTPTTAPEQAPADDARTAALPVVPHVAAPSAPVAEPEPTAPASEPAPADPIVVPAPALPTRAPRRPEADPADVPAAAEIDVPAPAGSARWVLERLAAARAADFDGVGRSELSADLVAVARMRSGGAGTGGDLFTPVVEGTGTTTGADRMERLRSLHIAARGLADDRGVVPAPRAMRSASALPGTRTGAENCGRAARRRDDAHASAATPIVAASGAAAARRRRKKPAHGA
ncbi:hypothetical protein GCM10009772_05530 [Pseudonocardia alni subsp. carboxydivorans]|uniref:acyltransferase family protein n=1 Tax=Pseudonocardia alni TaxID=33907 RepID=UPI0031F9B07B